jgi:hypothetical protein
MSTENHKKHETFSKSYHRLIATRMSTSNSSDALPLRSVPKLVKVVQVFCFCFRFSFLFFCVIFVLTPLRSAQGNFSTQLNRSGGEHVKAAIIRSVLAPKFCSNLEAHWNRRHLRRRWRVRSSESKTNDYQWETDTCLFSSMVYWMESVPETFWASSVHWLFHHESQDTSCSGLIGLKS